MKNLMEYSFVKELTKQLSTHIKNHPVKDVVNIVEMVNEWVTKVVDQFQNPEQIIPNPIEKIFSYFSGTTCVEVKSKIIKEKSYDFEHNLIKYVHHECEGLFSIEQFFSKKLFEKRSIVEKQSNPLSKRFLHKSVFIRPKNSIITWGGYENGRGITEEFLKFDLDQKKVTQIKSSTKGRIFHTLDFLPQLNKLAVYGGIEKSGNISSELLVCGMDFQWVSRGNETLPALCCHSTVSLFDTLYIFGGFNGTSLQYSSTMYSLHLSTLKLNPSKASFCPSERIGSAMTIVGDNIYICGGRDKNGNTLSDIYRYNISQDLYFPITCDEQSTNPSLCFSNMFLLGNNLYLYGGWNGVEWNNSLFETSTEEIKWKIVKYLSNDGVTFDSFNPMCSVVPVSDRSIYILGGLNSHFPFFSIMDTFVKLIISKDDSIMKGKMPSYRILQHKRQTDEFSLSQTYLKWLKEQIPEECDVTIVVNIPNQDEQELFYGQKLLLVRSPLLERKILEQEGHDKLKYGSSVVILLDNIPTDIENIRKPFNSVLEYLYSGTFSTRELGYKDYEAIYKIACYLEIRLLSQALDNTLSVDETLVTTNLVSSISTQLHHLFSSCETIHDIDEFMSTLDDNPVASGMVKIIVPISLDSKTYQSILVHRFMLTQRCHYFKTVFEMNFLEAHTRVVVIEQNTFKGLLSILHYIYTNSIVELDLSNVVEIFISSFQFELNELLDASKIFIREHEFDVFTTITLLEICETVNDKVMQDYCKYSIAKRYDQVMKQNPSALDNLSKGTRIDINDLRKFVLKH